MSRATNSVWFSNWFDTRCHSCISKYCVMKIVYLSLLDNIIALCQHYSIYIDGVIILRWCLQNLMCTFLLFCLICSVIRCWDPGIKFLDIFFRPWSDPSKSEVNLKEIYPSESVLCLYLNNNQPKKGSMFCQTKLW